MAPRRVAIVGISDHWGTELARRLERDPAHRLHRRDRHDRPRGEPRAHRFIEADIRNPVIARLLASTEVDTIVHCGIVWYPDPESRPAPFTTSTSSARCSCSPPASEPTTLERLVVRGSAAIYGCEGAAPLIFREEMARSCRCGRASSATSASSRTTSTTSPAATPSSPAACCASSPRSAPELDTPAVRYLSLPVVPTQLGFDPRLQLIHSEDATGALPPRSATRSAARSTSRPPARSP